MNEEDIRTNITDIYNKINYLKKLVTNNDNCDCCILELIKCQNCKNIICSKCDEQKCDVCKKSNCSKCLNHKTINTYPNCSNIGWYTCNSCQNNPYNNIKLYND
jgi:hypothetical protein